MNNNLLPDDFKVSVIIPTLNGGRDLPDFFHALKNQTCQPDEIIVGDSSSEDNTVEICTENGAVVIGIDKKQFDHGGTRTQLAQRAAGDIIVFFTQDAILSSQDCLEKILNVFKVDPQIACAYGRQLARPDATIFARHLREFNYPPVSYINDFSDRETKGLRTIFISNSFAVYKKAILEKFDYFRDGLIFGEDTYTLGKIIKAGYKVGYVSDACVYHSHNYGLLEEFRRSFDIGVLHSSENWLLETYGKAEGVGTLYIRSIFARLFQERKYLLMIDCFFRSGLKVIGYKLGKKYKKLPRALVPHLSMNKLWWFEHR